MSNIDIVEFGRFPVVPSPDNLKPRPDRRAVASVLPHESQMQVGELSANGWRYEMSYEEIYPASLVYSNSGRLAYVVREARQQFVVVNGEPQTQRWDGVSDELGWSSNGQQYSYVGKRGAELFVAAGEKVWNIAGAPLPHSFAQNCGGSKVSWLTQSQSQPQNQQLFVNGELHWEAPQFISNALWSPDGQRLVFAYGTGKGIVVRVDEREFGPYPGLNKGTPVWSPDSRRCGWVIERSGKSVVVLDGEEYRLPYSVVHGGTLAFSPDGSHWALAAHTGFLRLKGCIVADGQSGPVYLGLGTTPPVWNHDASALAYLAASGMKTVFVVCDGREGQRCTSFIDDSLVWHSAGDVVGCIAQQNGRGCLVLEGRDGQSWSLHPEVGSMLRGDTVVFDEGRSLHDLGFRNDFSIFGWTAHF